MNPTTKSLLRRTIQQAINSEQDAAAMELFALLTGSTPAVEPVHIALPATREVIDGPARDYHYWATFIRDKFLPYLVNNGRICFTSHEMFSWMENNKNMQFTAGDVQRRTNGGEIWRGIASNALTALKRGGIVESNPFSHRYLIVQSLPAQNDLNGLLNAGS